MSDSGDTSTMGNPFDDGIQAALVMWLRRLAGDRGVAYLLREHDFFRGIYFPVAASCCMLDRGEGPCDGSIPCTRHLQCYFMHPFTFAKQPRSVTVEVMVADLEAILKSWRVEALFLARSFLPPDESVSTTHQSIDQDKPRIVEKASDLADGMAVISVDDDIWRRSIYHFPSEDKDEYGTPSFALVVGGPEGGPFGGPTQSEIITLKRLLWKDWPFVSKPTFADQDHREGLLGELIRLFSDASPSPPNFNGAVFAVNAAPKSPFTYAVNPLAFNCYLAHAGQLLSGEPVPTLERVEELSRMLADEEAAPVSLSKADRHWLTMLAWFPQSDLMLARSPKKERNQIRKYYKEDNSDLSGTEADSTRVLERLIPEMAG
ncbi:hypothetical protein ACFL5Q_07940, partial [Planctomycetota bacterium]